MHTNEGTGSEDSKAEKASAVSANIEGSVLGGATSTTVADHLTNTQIGKFSSPGGTGFAAEDANSLNDKFQGKRVNQVGTDNAKDGADRIVDGVHVQTKYFESAARTVRDAFGADGNYRYGNTLLEVPSDQYDEAVQLMRKHIEEGNVPGFTNPDQAGDLVKKGSVTYKQARNIARAGNVDSLKYDAKNSAVTSGYAFAIGFVISYAKSTWDGENTRTALDMAVKTGLQTAATSFISSVVAAQLLRTQMARQGTVFFREGLRHAAKTKVGRVTIQKIASASLGKVVSGGAAVNHVAKLLRSNVITGVVTTTVLTLPDVYRAALKNNTSWAQVSKNLLVNASGVAAGTAGWMGGAVAGAALGSAVPILGTFVGAATGGVVGAVAAGWGGSTAGKYLLDHLIEDDAKKMLEIVQEGLVLIADDYLMTQAEFDAFSDRVSRKLTTDLLREMYAQENRQKFVADKFEAYCEELVRTRPPVAAPSEQVVRQFINEMIAKANEEAAIEESKGYLPNFVLVMGPVNHTKAADSGDSETVQDTVRFEIRPSMVAGVTSAAANVYSKVFGKTA